MPSKSDSSTTPGRNAPGRARTAKPCDATRERSPLGSITENSPKHPQEGLEVVRRSTGEVVRLELRRGSYVPAFDLSEHRARMYAMQRAARSVLPLRLMVRGKGRGVRVHSCLWTALRADVGASIHRHPETGRSHYGNLMVCGQIWACPLCASKVANRRAEDLQALVDDVKERGGRTWHVTFTFAHGPSEDLAEQIEALTKARQLFHRRRIIQAEKGAQGFIGYASALEVTHGDNGWHPHLHELWYCEDPILPERDPKRWDLFKDQIAETWGDVCVRRGLGRPSKRWGTLIQGGDSAGAYIAKELTHLVTKRASGKGRTSWQILEDAGRDPASAALFLEYIRATYGRHHVQTSRGLLQNMASDEELAAAQIEGADLLGILSPEDWHLVKATHQRAALLTVSEKGWSRVNDFLSALRGRQKVA